MVHRAPRMQSCSGTTAGPKEVKAIFFRLPGISLRHDACNDRFRRKMDRTADAVRRSSPPGKTQGTAEPGCEPMVLPALQLHNRRLPLEKKISAGGGKWTSKVRFHMTGGKINFPEEVPPKCAHTNRCWLLLLYIREGHICKLYFIITNPFF